MAHQPRPFPLESFRGGAAMAERLPQDPVSRGRPSARATGQPVGALGASQSLLAADGAGPAAGESLLAQALAHELRTTLALISGYSQTVRHLPLDSDVRVRYLERISTASTQLAELTDEILSVALSPQRGLQPAIEPVSLGQVYAQAASQIAAAVDTVEVCLHVPADLPLVAADAMWISLVIRNLVSNAAKYAGGSPVSVTAWKSGGSVVTRVSDEGDGVDRVDLGHIFEPMFRGRRARETGAPGSGRGLYLCSRLIEAHCGRIWIDDSESGLAVCFSLPRAPRPMRSERRVGSRVAVGPGRAHRPGA